MHMLCHRNRRISFDDTLREVCMVFFFTSVGFQANLKVLKAGQIAHRILGTGNIAYHITKPNRRGACKALKLKSANRHVHRLYPYGWRTWHRRSLWPGARGPKHKGRHDHLYSCSYLRSHLWKLDRRTSWKKLIENIACLIQQQTRTTACWWRMKKA